MTLILEEEQIELGRVVRDLVSSEPIDLRAQDAFLAARSVWDRLATEVGVHGLAVPEGDGGAGASVLEQALVFEELGRSLSPLPYLSTVGLCIPALQAAEGAAAAEVLAVLASGEQTAALAIRGDSDAWGSVVQSVWAEQGLEDDVTLRGHARAVLDGADADIVLVLADDDAGGSLYVVDALNKAGFSAHELTTLDPSRRIADLDFDNVRARRLGVPGSAAAVAASVLDIATLFLAAEDLGVAARTLDMSVEYAKIRVQFDRPIGSFQAIKHHCADMLVAVESARTAVWHAARSEGTAEFSVAAPMARVVAGDAAKLCARLNIQIHGGVGCTWEHDAHLYYRRAQSNAMLLGPADASIRRLSDAVIRTGRP